MRARSVPCALFIVCGLAAGCATTPPPAANYAWATQPSVQPKKHEPAIRLVEHREVVLQPSAATVDDLVRIAVARNPRLARATFGIDAAQGRYVQAGLYPNPELAIYWDEIGDRTGTGGVLNIPQVTQEIVRGKKLSLSQAVAATEINQANLNLLAERYAVVAAVRAAYYDLYALERRIAALDDLVRLSGEAVKIANTLLENKQIARLDLVQLEVEHSRLRADADSARRELPATRKRLAAVVGEPTLTIGVAAGPFEDVPLYDPDRTLETVLATHPEVRTAKVGVERAAAAVRRAEAEVIPNVKFSTGYIRQFENRSHDFQLGFAAPLPTWNRNQGNIRTAKAEQAIALQDVGRVENDLTDRVTASLRTYAAAAERVDHYRTDILPKTEENYKLSQEAFKGGQLDYLRAFQAQRAVAEARLEYNRALGEAWKSAAELSGFLLEEWWPGPPPNAVKPR